MTTTEKNRTLADFVGLIKVNSVRNENGKYFDYELNDNFTLIKEEEIQIESNNGLGLVSQDYVFAEDLIFHSDWNWLMVVVEKIESLGYKINNFSNNNYIYIGKDDVSSVIINEASLTKKEAFYNACVNFIQWYNENKNNATLEVLQRTNYNRRSY